MRCVRHAFETTGDSNAISSGTDTVDAKDRCLHATAAGLVHGNGTHVVGHTGVASSLARRALLESCGQYAAHKHFINDCCIDIGAFHSGFNRGAA